MYILALGINDSNSNTVIGNVNDIDIENGNGPDNFYGNYSKIVHYVKQKSPNAKLIFLSLFRIPQEHNPEEYDNAIKNLATVANGRYIDVNTNYAIKNILPNFISDYHPTMVGYNLISKALAEIISADIANAPEYYNNLIPVNNN